jgi:hypothetical protein
LNHGAHGARLPLGKGVAAGRRVRHRGVIAVAETDSKISEMPKREKRRKELRMTFFYFRNERIPQLPGRGSTR